MLLFNAKEVIEYKNSNKGKETKLYLEEVKIISNSIESISNTKVAKNSI